MIKFRVQSSLFVVFLIAIFLRTTNYELPTVYAVDSTPSAEIRVKLEELKKEIASKAAKLKQEVNKKLQNKAYVGKVKTKTGSSLTLATQTGAKIVSLNQDSVFESLVKTKKLSLKTLAEEDYIAALGDIDDTQVLTAKKIVLLPQESTAKTFLWGQIIATSDKLVTLKDRHLKNIAVATSQAELKGDLKLNQFAILTGFFNKNEIFEAGFIYIIPQGGFIKPKKMASPSAKPVR